MSDKEKQHYVPKFYLKRFSYRNNQSQIGVFNTKTNLFVQTAKLKTQAYRSFFYGKDGFIETQLGIIEGISAELIREISSNHYVPKLGSSDHQTILLHTVTSLMRTPTMTNSINETFSEMNNLVKGNAKEWNAKFEPIDSFDGEALKMALNGIKIGVDHCKDLCVKLIINRTKKPFITSDNPVVKYNSFMEKRNWPGSGTGFSSLGLKIFLALDPSVMIVFYDSWIYKIGDRRQTVIETNNELDIDNLNLIHFINCNNIIFFNQDASKEYITQLHERSKKFIKANIPIVKEYPYIDPYGNTSSKSTIMVSSQTDCKTNMSLSFMKLTSNAKEYIFDNKAVKLRKGHEHREKYRS